MRVFPSLGLGCFACFHQVHHFEQRLQLPWIQLTQYQLLSLGWRLHSTLLRVWQGSWVDMWDFTLVVLSQLSNVGKITKQVQSKEYLSE
ncbi:hypothetical protein vseg_011521 [Gypsophila vaccaria]